jgi:arabinofuranosyltransferase
MGFVAGSSSPLSLHTRIRGPITLWVLLFVLLIAYVITLYCTAWLDDDSHITFRVIENFYNGYGLRWNVIERVQVYTHPLWLLVIGAAYSITGEFFLTVLILSIVVSFSAVVIFVFCLADSVGLAALGMAVLLCSKSFVEYSTSGLENPLIFLLLGWFVWSFKRWSGSARDLLTLSFIASLVTLARLDAILLIGPAAVFAYADTRCRKRPLLVLLGFLPLVAWEIFSLVYYGFFLPNTAYAKLGTGIPCSILLDTGLNYFKNQWHFDCVSLVAIYLCVFTPVVLRRWRYVSFSLGILLYLSYILMIGGDFMLGRFFAAPLFLAVTLLGCMELKLNLLTVCTGIAGASLLGLTAPNPALFTGKDYGAKPLKFQSRPTGGVGDERYFYYQGCGLRQYEKGKIMPCHEWFTYVGGLFKNYPGIQRIGAAGMIGLRAGPRNYLIDVFAITDPLLARLPMAGTIFRIGHFPRNTPAGYIATIKTGEDQFLDQNLGAYYRHLSRVIRGPLFSEERWQSIWLLNTGQLSNLIDIDYYRQRTLPELSIFELEAIKQTGDNRNWVDIIKISSSQGLRVHLCDEWHYPTLDVSIDAGIPYLFRFLKDGTLLGETLFASPVEKKQFLVRTGIEVPDHAAELGYDEIQVSARKKGDYVIGHIIGVNAPSYVNLGQLAKPKEEHSHPKLVGAIEILPFSPLRVLIGKSQKARQIDISFDYNDVYSLAFYLSGKHLKTLEISGPPSFGGLSHLVVAVPDIATNEGYDEIRIGVVKTDGYASIGHLILK